MTVAKLRGARERKRREGGKCEGRKSHAERNPELVALAKRLHRHKPKGGACRSGRSRPSWQNNHVSLALREVVEAHRTITDRWGQMSGRGQTRSFGDVGFAVRFGPLCGLKSDISRGRRSAKGLNRSRGRALRAAGTAT